MDTTQNTTIDELKTAILYAEIIVSSFERSRDFLKVNVSPATYRDMEWQARIMQIAAACMWEKLERLEKEAGTC